MELAELAQNYFGNTRSGSLVGPIGGFIVALLAVTTVLLVRNMNARLRRLPARFPEPPASVGRTSTGSDSGRPAATGPHEPDSDPRTG